MNRDYLRGNWNQLKGRVRRQWGKLTDDEVDIIRGDQEILIGKIQEHYGRSREEAEREVRAWLEATSRDLRPAVAASAVRPHRARGRRLFLPRRASPNTGKGSGLVEAQVGWSTMGRSSVRLDQPDGSSLDAAAVLLVAMAMAACTGPRVPGTPRRPCRLHRSRPWRTAGVDQYRVGPVGEREVDRPARRDDAAGRARGRGAAC
jgi:uncharacterized protein YjbJ (UPF0337 family)